MNTKAIKPHHHKLAQAIALGVLALAANQAQATKYTFSDLGTMTGAPYAGNAIAMGINNLGQVVGYGGPGDSAVAFIWNGDTTTQLDTLPGSVKTYAYAINETSQIAGFNDLYPVVDDGYPIRWDGTTPTKLDTLGGGYATGAFAINNPGQLVGVSWSLDSQSFHAARWDGTALTELSTLGGITGYALGINDSGQIVGQSTTAGEDAQHATLWNGTTPTDLGTLGGTNSAAANINNAGQIVGYSDLADGATSHAVLWNGATLTELAALGGDGTISYASDINNVGQIVGWSDIAAGNTHATLWEGASLLDLNSFLPNNLASAGWVLNYAYAINDHGVIVGQASNGLDPATATYAAFKLTPSAVPVPGAVWLFGSALAGFVGIKRRKQVVI